MSSKCKFKEEWKMNPEFKDLIQHVTGDVHWTCTLSCKVKAMDQS